MITSLISCAGGQEPQGSMAPESDSIELRQDFTPEELAIYIKNLIITSDEGSFFNIISEDLKNDELFYEWIFGNGLGGFQSVKQFFVGAEKISIIVGETMVNEKENWTEYLFFYYDSSSIDIEEAKKEYATEEAWWKFREENWWTGYVETLVRRSNGKWNFQDVHPFFYEQEPFYSDEQG